MKGMQPVSPKNFDRALKSNIVSEVRAVRNKKGIWKIYFMINLELSEDMIFVLTTQRGEIKEWKTLAGLFTFLDEKKLVNKKLRLIEEE